MANTSPGKPAPVPTSKSLPFWKFAILTKVKES